MMCRKRDAIVWGRISCPFHILDLVRGKKWGENVVFNFEFMSVFVWLCLDLGFGKYMAGKGNCQGKR